MRGVRKGRRQQNPDKCLKYCACMLGLHSRTCESGVWGGAQAPPEGCLGNSGLNPWLRPGCHLFSFLVPPLAERHICLKTFYS